MPKKKSSRRRPGEGSVYKRKDGRFVAEITLEDGSRKQYYFKKESDAVAKKNQLLYEMQQGLLATGPRQTMKQYLEYWLENVHRVHLRITTYARHRTIVYRHLIPAIGHIQLQKLRPEHIERLYARKYDEGYAPASIGDMRKVLHNALKNAVQKRYVAQNVCDLVKPPPITKHEAQTLTQEQAIQLLKTAKGHQLESLVALAFTTGMRHGELAALRWQDINFTENSLQVRHKVYRLSGYGYIEGDPKTEKSKREIMLPQFVIESLKAHRARQLEVRSKAGSRWQDRDLVFPNRYGGFVRSEILLGRFRRLLAEAGLPSTMRLHDLRHTISTLLAAMKYPPNLVQELLGHSDVNTTLGVYTHVDLDMQRKMMNDLNDLFGGNF